MTDVVSVFPHARVERAYWRSLRRHDLDNTDERQLAFWLGWVAGGAEVLRQSAELAHVVPTLSEFIEILRADV
jgi:hypothetical protein